MASISTATTSLPSVQTVWKIVRRGDPAKALVKDQNAPVPTKIPEGYVLVKIQAASLNPVYVYCSYHPSAYLTFPTDASN